MKRPPARLDRILVIKLAALGDFVQAFGPFAAIRAHHPHAEITLLTTSPFHGIASLCPWFDNVWADGRPAWTDFKAVAALARKLRRGRFGRVYDLQTSQRTSWYRLAVGMDAEWSGIARGASHPDTNPRRNFMHTLERQRSQLALAGIEHFPEPDLGWLDQDISGFALPRTFTLLLPGASAKRPAKRWPAASYAELAANLPCLSVICGAQSERDLAKAIRDASPSAIDLTGLTDLPHLAAIARRATVVVGNDSGPTHLAAAVGSPTLCLFGPESDPALCAPRGPNASYLRRSNLEALRVEEVTDWLDARGVFSNAVRKAI